MYLRIVKNGKQYVVVFAILFFVEKVRKGEIMADKILTAQEVADLLAVNKSTIYRLARANQIPHFNVGSVVRFSSEQIENWMNPKTDGYSNNEGDK